MNKESLFNTLRELAKTLTQTQVDSVNAILDSCIKHGIIDKRYIAYILATCYHESGLKPIEEIGKGKGLPYGSKLDIGKGAGKRVAYSKPDKLYYGRGFVQITWLSNYKAFSKLLKLDLVNRPELALQIDIAAEIIVLGMLKGMFTGVKLADAFNDNESDAIEAREIVNGHDKAALIKGYYDKIYNSIK
jgi:putative chitinase